MRFAGMLALLLVLGCTEPKAVAQPLPPEMVDAILNPTPALPPEPSPIGAAVGDLLDKAAADAEQPRVEVEMLTATWCGPCKRAHEKVVPWLHAKGYVVTEVDCSEVDFQKQYGVNGLPTFIFKRGNEAPVKVTGPRYEQGTGNPWAPDFKEAFDKFPPPPKTMMAMGMSPTVSLADFTNQIAGLDQDLWGVVHVTVPKDVTWTLTQRPASVLLTFPEGRRPTAKSLKYIRANPDILSVEISPLWVEIKTNSLWPMLRSIRVEFDWSPPAAVKKVSGRSYYYYRTPQNWTPVPQKPKPVVEEQPTVANPEPIKLGTGDPVAVPVAHVWRATVSIWTKSDKLYYNLMGLPATKETEGCGSGMIVTPQGHILTNQHVIDGCKSVEIEFCDGQKRKATLVGTDKQNDLAVVKVEGVDLPVVKWADSKPMVGIDVYLTGNPHGYGESVCRGVVSGLNREADTNDDRKYTGLIQVDTPTNPGNSGGPVSNAKGDVIGVMSVMRCGSGVQGISFCIPASVAKDAVGRLVKP